MITSLDQIKVGQKYRSRAFPNTVYLGCLEVDRSAKFLVIIEDNDTCFEEGETSTLGHRVDFSCYGVGKFGFYLDNN